MTVKKGPITIITRAIAIILSSSLLLASAIIVYYAIAGYVMYKDVTDGTDIPSMIAEIRASESFVTVDELPPLYKQGVIAVEDSRFYMHNGLDYISIAKAAIRNGVSFSMTYGGSTITQQLAKNLFFTFEKKLERKFAEAYMAPFLEHMLTKDEILELYVNVIDFGNRYTGIYEAAIGYYGKHPHDLDPYECAMLIGVPNAPDFYSPAVDPVLAEKRREVVIEKLVETGIWPY